MATTLKPAGSEPRAAARGIRLVQDVGAGEEPRREVESNRAHDLEEAVQMADKVLLLSRRPTREAALVDNLLPRPRDAGTLTEPAFVDLRSECLKIFQKEALVNELSN